MTKCCGWDSIQWLWATIVPFHEAFYQHMPLLKWDLTIFDTKSNNVDLSFVLFPSKKRERWKSPSCSALKSDLKAVSFRSASARSVFANMSFIQNWLTLPPCSTMAMDEYLYRRGWGWPMRGCIWFAALAFGTDFEDMAPALLLCRPIILDTSCHTLAHSDRYASNVDWQI